ncbi:MAG: hypothetical protein COZ18_12375 [Flexibacter sp. CG_4_10_14_3_um_filter_32_15]|nr:MAG: hypothetical protein COZ18_12375 [Flexibacter sp. CG_4_10_14_3_um_filter_32_15]
MQKRLFYFLRIFGVILLFIVWFFLGMNRMQLASFISTTFSSIPFISVLDMGTIGLLFILLNAIIIWLCFASISSIKKTVVIHFLIYILIVILILAYKFFETHFLFNLSENLLRFYFSPLIPLFSILLFYILNKLEN